MWIRLIISIAFTRQIVGNWHEEDIEGWQDVSELGFKIDKGNEKKTNFEPRAECTATGTTVCDCGASELHCGTLKKLLARISLNSLVRVVDEEYVELKVKFAHGELKLLKDYALENCKNNGNEITRIINKAIRNIEVIPSNKIDWLMLVYDFINHNQEIIGLIVVTCLVFLLLLWWWTFSKSWTEVGMKGFVLLFVLSSIWDWMRLYKNALAVKEAGIAQIGGEIPVQCRPSEMTFFQSLVALYKGSFTFNENECRKYYKLYLVDPFWDANPLTAVVDNLSRMIFHPLAVLGEYIANFLKELFSRLPAHLWVPVGFVLVIVLLLCLIMYFNYRVRLPLLFGALEPGHPPPQNQQSHLLGGSQKAIFHHGGNSPAVLRIELVNNTPNSTSNCDRCESISTNNSVPITENVETYLNDTPKDGYEENVSIPENLDLIEENKFPINLPNDNDNGDKLLIPPGNKISTVIK